MDRGAWWATVHRVAQSWTRLKRLSMHTASKRVSVCVIVYVCLQRLCLCERKREIFVWLKSHSLCVHLLEQPRLYRN